MATFSQRIIGAVKLDVATYEDRMGEGDSLEDVKESTWKLEGRTN